LSEALSRPALENRIKVAKSGAFVRRIESAGVEKPDKSREMRGFCPKVGGSKSFDFG
jgi:hypothetical protein